MYVFYLCYMSAILTIRKLFDNFFSLSLAGIPLSLWFYSTPMFGCHVLFLHCLFFFLSTVCRSPSLSLTPALPLSPAVSILFSFRLETEIVFQDLNTIYIIQFIKYSFRHNIQHKTQTEDLSDHTSTHTRPCIHMNMYVLYYSVLYAVYCTQCDGNVIDTSAWYISVGGRQRWRQRSCWWRRCKALEAQHTHTHKPMAYNATQNIIIIKKRIQAD